jgi:thioredoxin 1
MPCPRSIAALATLAVLVLSLSLDAARAEPAFFTDKPYAQAKDQAQREGKLLLVKATAAWCGPCKVMDRTTFKDQAVVDWLTERAVSVSVDVDDEPELAQRLGVRAMPTTILFKGDEELSRVVGLRKAPDFVRWLIEHGGRGGPASRAEPERSPMHRRLVAARELARGGEAERATEEFVWLWENIEDVEPGMSGVRVSFMASDMRDLAADHAGARTAFGALRDEARARSEKSPRDAESLRDWLVLSERVLGDRDAVVGWVDEIKGRSNARRLFAQVDDIVSPVLIDRGEWAVLGSLIDTPDRRLRNDARILDAPAGDAEQRTRYERVFRGNAARMHAALLAANRDRAAWDAAEYAMDTLDDPKTRAELVETAHKAGVLTQRHLDLLDPDEPAHTELLERARPGLEE